ncbi:TOBE domain-containing protein [Nonomuraea jabiensis]|uniref:TOBE domain-containing protein n=1 Tax=Nonomuraea jabiensis TaxID=882448 RepID=UPI0036BFE407
MVIAMRALCAERKQRITLDTPQVTPRIQADPMPIVQALTNLLSNASRFTTVGGGIDVRVARTAFHGHSVDYEVETASGTLLVTVPGPDPQGLPAEGTNVTVGIDPGRAYVLTKS